MSSPIDEATSFIRGAGEKAGGAAGGIAGKIVGSLAGLLLIFAILKESFYKVKVGQRGVLMRSGKPVLKKNGRVCLALSKLFGSLRLRRLADLFADLGTWRKSRQVGLYKVKRPGIGMKLAGWYDVIKVDVQRRVQKLDSFDADCPDGQRHFKPDLVTRVPCDDDGPEYHDYPALRIIHSYEADEIFESFGGNQLLTLLETVTAEVRNDRDALNALLIEKAGAEFERCAYLLEGVNLRQRSLTPIEKAIKAFGPQEDNSHVGEEPAEKSNVLPMLPHQVVMATALPDIASTP
jgi:hypothetical protein